MKDYTTDKRVVLNLDAGGTNMVFCAIRGGEFISKSVTLPSNPDNLDLYLDNLYL